MAKDALRIGMAKDALHIGMAKDALHIGMAKDAFMKMKNILINPKIDIKVRIRILNHHSRSYLWLRVLDSKKSSNKS